MTLENKRTFVRQHLEEAVRLQRKTWDEALAIQDATGNRECDIYSFVAELAGGLADNEAVPEEIIDVLVVQTSLIERENIQ